MHYEESVLCRAPATEVWKLLHDPARFTEWWVGVSRVETTAEGVTLYPDDHPAAPTRVTAGRDGTQVVVNCLMTEDVFVWTLEPHPEGCRITARVMVFDGDRDRLAQRREGVQASLPRLVAAAQRAAAVTGAGPGAGGPEWAGGRRTPGEPVGADQPVDAARPGRDRP